MTQARKYVTRENVSTKARQVRKLASTPSTQPHMDAEHVSTQARQTRDLADSRVLLHFNIIHILLPLYITSSCSFSANNIINRLETFSPCLKKIN